MVPFRRCYNMDKTSKTGVYTASLKNGTVAFYLKYRISGKQYKQKIGLDTEGWTINKAYKELQKRISTNIGTPINRSTMTLTEAFNSYIESISHKSDCYNTISRYETNIKITLGHLRLKDITPLILLKFKSKMATGISEKTGKPLASRTVDGLLDLINQTYNFHIKIENYKGDSPATPKLVSRFNEDNSRKGFLSKDDYRQLIYTLENRTKLYINTRPHITQQLLLFVKLAVTTGGRRGTLLTIKKKDLNFETNTIALYNHKVKRAYQAYIHPSIKEFLRDQTDAIEDENYILGGKSKPLCPNTISKRLQPILNDLFNENITDRRERIVLHSFRHTFGSWLAQANTSLYQIMKLLDHSQISQTQMYAKLLPNSGAEEVRKLSI